MSINKAHQNFEHISHATIKHMVKTRMVTGIKLNPESKPEFFKPCDEAKSNHQPFPKESTTWGTWYGVHALGPLGPSNSPESGWAFIRHSLDG